MSTLDVPARPAVRPKMSDRATKVEVGEDMLVVHLEDGRVIGVPIMWFPRLAAAQESERSNWRLIGGGIGINWPDLDEDISVRNLLCA